MGKFDNADKDSLSHRHLGKATGRHPKFPFLTGAADGYWVGKTNSPFRIIEELEAKLEASQIWVTIRHTTGKDDPLADYCNEPGQIVGVRTKDDDNDNTKLSILFLDGNIVEGSPSQVEIIDKKLISLFSIHLEHLPSNTYFKYGLHEWVFYKYHQNEIVCLTTGEKQKGGFPMACRVYPIIKGLGGEEGLKAKVCRFNREGQCTHHFITGKSSMSSECTDCLEKPCQKKWD